MADKNIAVFAIYSPVATLENGLNELKQAGFRHEDISVLFPENLGSKELTTVKSSKGPEGLAAGASSGAVLGGALGWLAGIGALAIPGAGPFIAAGPIMAALSGAATGGLTGALIGMGIPEYEARRYNDRLREGNVLISVHSDSDEETRRAKEIFERNGAEDIATAREEAVAHSR